MTSSVHPFAEVGFSANPQTYVRGRPEYPAGIDEWLAGDLGLRSGRRALDLGAGTGKFTKRLLATGAGVCAVDPVPAMLDQLRRQDLGVELKAGSAEAIPFGDASFDAVVCAQSFHWFATFGALVEIHRVLKPGGRLGLIWNVRDESVEWVAALTRIMEPFEGDAPRYSSQRWRDVFPAAGFGPFLERRFSNEHRGAPEEVIVDRILSVSFIAALDAAARDHVAAQIRELIAVTLDLKEKTEVSFPYETVALSCTKL